MRGQKTTQSQKAGLAKAKQCASLWLATHDAAPTAMREALRGAFDVWMEVVVMTIRGCGLGFHFHHPESRFHKFFLCLDAVRGESKTKAGEPHELQRVADILCRVLPEAVTHEMFLNLLIGAIHAPSEFRQLLAGPRATELLQGEALDRLFRNVAIFAKVVWHILVDPALPFAERFVNEQWGRKIGDCWFSYFCLSSDFILNNEKKDKIGEWLASRLPPHCLNQSDSNGHRPLIMALRAGLSRTVGALLSRVPDVDLSLFDRVMTEREAYEAVKPHMADGEASAILWEGLLEDLKLKTQQFNINYPQQATTECTSILTKNFAMPRELVSIVLAYTALPTTPSAVASTGAEADVENAKR